MTRLSNRVKCPHGAVTAVTPVVSLERGLERRTVTRHEGPSRLGQQVRLKPNIWPVNSRRALSRLHVLPFSSVANTRPRTTALTSSSLRGSSSLADFSSFCAVLRC